MQGHICNTTIESTSDTVVTGLVDSHAHLSQNAFNSDRDEVILRARQMGLVSILSVGTEPDEFQKEIAIAGQHTDLIHLAIGYHPHIAKDMTEQHYTDLKALINNTKEVIAVGETGLDYYYKHSTPKEQETAFRIQLRIASEASLPVIIHCRDAYEEMIKILKSEDITPKRILIHCFSGNIKHAKELLDYGATLSFAGPVTYKKAEGLRDVVRMTPLKRLLAETDAPYLSPQGHRGKRNEPSYILETYEKIAQIKGISLNGLIGQVAKNYYSFFNIKPKIMMDS